MNAPLCKIIRRGKPWMSGASLSARGSTMTSRYSYEQWLHLECGHKVRQKYPPNRTSERMRCKQCLAAIEAVASTGAAHE